MYLPYSPFFIRWFYPELTWHKSRKEQCIYLTFDDGPIPDVTPWVLNTLKKFNVKATFFCIGDNISKHPQIFQQILNDGHSVGNHTYNHLNGWKTHNDEYISNIDRCKELVNSNLFRPPYGRAKKSQYSILNTQYSTIMWDVLSGDFDPAISPEKCLKNVLTYSKNGSIIVFHDSLKAFPRLEYALPQTLELLIKRGFQFSGL